MPDLQRECNNSATNIRNAPRRTPTPILSPRLLTFVAIRIIERRQTSELCYRSVFAFTSANSEDCPGAVCVNHYPPMRNVSFNSIQEWWDCLKAQVPKALKNRSGKNLYGSSERRSVILLLSAYRFPPLGFAQKSKSVPCPQLSPR